VLLLFAVPPTLLRLSMTPTRPAHCPKPLVLVSISTMVCACAAILFLLLGPELSYALPGSRQTILRPNAHPLDAPSWGNPPHHKDKWNVLYHQGGNGPWIQKFDGVLDGGIELPEGCQVDMAHGVSVHTPTHNMKISDRKRRCLVMERDIPP
jgi:hypothetical protein